MNLHTQPASSDLLSVMQIGEIFQGVTSFLKPTELYNLTNTCHTMHDNHYLDVTTVVKVALFNGNKWTRTTIENIYHQLLSNAIFMPSIHRLLLLTVIKSCEFCGNNKIHYVSNFCLAFCNTCRQHKTISCYMKPPGQLRRSVEINDLLQHPSVLSIVHHLENETGHKFSPKHQVSYVLKKPAFDGNHERIGPAITNEDLNTMLTLPNYEHVENYILDQQPLSSQNRDDFISAVNMYRTSSYDHAQTKIRNREVWKAYRKKKLQNAIQALKNLMEFIPPELHHHFGNHVDHFYQDYEHCSYRVCIHMDNAFITNRLRPLLRAPSRYLTITQKNHKQDLLDLAIILCRHFSALPNPRYAATW